MSDKKQVQYTSTGVYPVRNGRGLKTSLKKLSNLDDPEDSDADDQSQMHHESMSTLIGKIEHISNGYLEGAAITASKVINKISDHPGYPHPSGKKEKESKIWPAIAFGPNVCLPKHTDQDSFFSAINVLADDFSPATVAPPSVPDKSPNFRLDSPILCYFCFPDHGFAVGLRSGDVLLINPCVPHCISARIDNQIDVFSSSMHLKTNVVGGNDNDRQEGIDYVFTNVN